MAARGRRQTLLVGAVQAFALHAGTLALFLVAPRPELVRVSVAVDPARPAPPPRRDGRAGGGVEGGAAAAVGREEEPLGVFLDASEPTPALAPTVVNVGPEDASPPPRRRVARAAGPTKRGRAAAPALLDQLAKYQHRPVFVPADATPAQVDQMWRTSILRQQITLNKDLLHARGQEMVATRLSSGVPTGGRPVAGDGLGRGGGVGDGSGAALRADLGGRLTAASRVARAPQVIGDPEGVCESFSAEAPRTMVRFLVSRRGEVVDRFVRRPSGDGRFDQCALTFVQGIRFRPGQDQNGANLDVWLNAQVRTDDCDQAGCRERLRLEQ